MLFTTDLLNNVLHCECVVLKQSDELDDEVYQDCPVSLYWLLYLLNLNISKMLVNQMSLVNICVIIINIILSLSYFMLFTTDLLNNVLHCECVVLKQSDALYDEVYKDCPVSLYWLIYLFNLNISTMLVYQY